jgi:PAS domain S-box-containing protein
MGRVSGNHSELAAELEKLDLHDHLCLIYETREEQLAAAIPFIRIGLERGEQCVYIADDNDLEIILAAMRDRSIDIDAAIRSGALRVVTKRESYLQTGAFDPDWMIGFLREAVDKAREAGFQALRVTGEMTWALGQDPGTDRLMEYEAKLNYLFPERDVLAICQYNRRRFDPEIIQGVINTHPIVIYGSLVCRNLYYIPPDEFLGPRQAGLQVERMLRNLLDARQAEETHSRLAAIVESSEDAIIGKSPDGTILSWNGGAARIYGYAAEEAVGRPVSLLVPADLPGEIPRILDSIARGECVGHHETVRRRKDGRRIDVSLSISPIRDGRGRVVGASAIARDITDHKRAEEALRAAKTRAESERVKTEAIVAAIGDGLSIQDREFRIVYQNERHRAVMGEHVDEKCFNAYWGNDQQCEGCPMARTFRDGGVHLEEREIRFNGDLRYFEITTSPLRDASGEVTAGIEILRDVTERKRAEEEVRRLNVELERRVVERTAELAAANKELEAFAYSVSHDLRAPLRSMDGFSQALLEDYDGRLDDQGRDYLRRIRAATQRMGRLIDDLLNLSRVTRWELRREPVDLSALARTIAYELPGALPDREIEISVQDGLVAVGDPRLLRTVLENLLGNAWKFSAERNPAIIEVGLALPDDGPAFFVRDNGIGFDMAYAGKLFAPFQRLHAAYEGTGIGLSIVQRIVHRHGGRIWAHGKPGQGATFYFSLEQAERRTFP